MDVLVLVETRKLFVWWIVGERQTATSAACIAAVRANLVALTAVAAANRGDVVNQVLIVSHISTLTSGPNCATDYTDEKPDPSLIREIRGYLMLKMPDAGENHREAVLIGSGDNLFIADGTARLYHRSNSMTRRLVDPVAKRKERI